MLLTMTRIVRYLQINLVNNARVLYFENYDFVEKKKKTFEKFKRHKTTFYEAATVSKLPQHFML